MRFSFSHYLTLGILLLTILFTILNLVQVLPMLSRNIEGIALIRSLGATNPYQTEPRVEQLTRSVAFDRDPNAARVLGAFLIAFAYYDDAVSLLSPIPADSIVSMRLATALEALGQPDDALRVWQTIPAAHGYLTHLAEQSLARGKLAEALGHVQMAIRVRPAYVQAHYIRGRILAAQQRLDESIAAYEKAIMLAQGREPSFYHYFLGIALSRAGKADQAIAEMNIALQIQPRDASALEQLTILYLGKNDLISARATAQQGIVTFPAMARFYSKLGEIAYRMGQPAEAVTWFTRARQVEPLSATSYYAEGQIALSERRLNEAIQLLAMAAERDPRNIGIRLDLARALSSAGVFDDSVFQYREAIRLAGSNCQSAGYRHELIDLLVKLSKPDQAKQEVRILLTLCPNDERAIQMSQK